MTEQGVEFPKLLGLDGAPPSAVLLGVKVVAGVGLHTEQKPDHLGEHVQLEQLVALAGALKRETEEQLN